VCSEEIVSKTEHQFFFKGRISKTGATLVVEEFKYLGRTLTNENSIPEEIKCRLNHVMHAIIRCIVFFLPGSYPKFKDQDMWNYNFAVFLYGCETWSLTLREERKLVVFEYIVLRRIFSSKGDEVTAEWRRLHKEELNDLYCSPNILRVIKSRSL